MKSITAAASLIGLASAAGATAFTYAGNGANWKDIAGYEDCGKPGQSPINLLNDFSTYTKYDIKEDKFSKTYTNQRDIQILWDTKGLTTKVTFNKAPNTFSSTIGETIYNTHVKKWDGIQFHFHAGSEHFVDGEQQDFEMHTVHYSTPRTGAEDYKASAIGIMFSVNKYNVKLSRAEELVIDTFFETMDWGKVSDPTVNLVTYGDLMMMVDTDNRWVYKGSVTTPPCAQAVYWNVLHKIYPIKQVHLDQFKAQLARGGAALATGGNNRVIQDAVATHAVGVVTETGLGSDKDSANDINYNININIYNQNVGSGTCPTS